jgi:UDP-N-acetylglucosamine--N-acetylmuramyl-(pentapeptide) pyrophosphoryl-undecaprenol N-acetylglucosamine transferase
MRKVRSGDLGKAGAGRRVALVGGGTGGHVRAALGVGEAYQRLRGDLEVLYLGARRGFQVESRLVPGAGQRLELIDARPVMGTGLWGTARASVSLVVGVAQARRILRRNGIQVVVGFGGYATPAAILAARTLGLPAAIHEANVVPGRANRLLQRYASHVFLGCETDWSWRSPRAVSEVGFPISAEIAALADIDRTLPDPTARPVRVFVTGGSLGSCFLNREAPGLIGLLREEGLSVDVVHQTGWGNEDLVSRAYGHRGLAARVSAFVSDMAGLYRWADFILCTAGAATLAEVAAAGVPALIVPLRGVTDAHQDANARRYAAAGAMVVAESDWRTPELAGRTAALLRDPSVWKEAAAGVQSLARPDAAMTIARRCEDLVLSAESGGRTRL